MTAHHVENRAATMHDYWREQENGFILLIMYIMVPLSRGRIRSGKYSHTCINSKGLQSFMNSMKSPIELADEWHCE